jgi:hypothetical protein
MAFEYPPTSESGVWFMISFRHEQEVVHGKYDTVVVDADAERG